MYFEKFYPSAGRKEYREGVSETDSMFSQRLSFLLHGILPAVFASAPY